jgi:hypothetical protein
MASLKKHNERYRFKQTLTIDTNAYTANDIVGGLLTIPSGPGTLRVAKLTDADSEGAALDLFLFHTLPTISSMVDDAAFAATSANALNFLERRIRFEAANYVTIASADDYCFGTDNLSPNLAIECDPTDGENMYGLLVCVGTPTYTAATDLYLDLMFWQD